jgi:predicted AAA+ superfamily ATPase
MGIIKRHLKAEIKEHLTRKEITLITGARQVGKTTLVKEIMEELKSVGERVVYFNLDIDNHFSFFNTQETFLGRIYLEIGISGYVFIDEIQRLENAGIFLKGLYDRELPYKLVVTGSGSMELKEKIQESLAGRKRIFEMMPVNFVEFVNYRTGYKYEDKLNLYFDLEKEQTLLFLKEYLNFGGYPAVVTEAIFQEKIKVMDDIFRSYIEKDLVYLMRIEQPELFKYLIKVLAVLSGRLINYTELARQVNISVPTFKKYLWYAEKTFTLHPVTPWYTNPLKEITKSSIVYFNDLGFMNHTQGIMGKLQDPVQFGFVFQNFVFLILKEACRWKNCSVHFWRTSDKAEVDFVLDQGTKTIPAEVKFGEVFNRSVSRSFRSYIEKYKPVEAWIINRSISDQMTINQTLVKFMPYWKLFGWQ